jgi:hypothetical protein
MFDYGPGERAPFSGRENKGTPSVAVTKPRVEIVIDERTGLELYSLWERANKDVPNFVTVQPRVEIIIDERAAALEKNPHFRCLGHNHGDYFFLSKRSGEVMVMSDFKKVRILALAPLAYWLAWSSTGDCKQRMIADALIQLAQRAGQYIQDYSHLRVPA